MEQRVILAGTPRASDGLKNTNSAEIIIAISAGFAPTPGDGEEGMSAAEVRAGGAQSEVQGTARGPRAALNADEDHLFPLTMTVI